MPKRRKTNDEFSLIAEVARSGHGRSPLYWWMRRRHDDFAVLLEENRPDWTALAEAFADKLGFCGADGKPLAPATVRHTWWRCRRDVARRREKRPQKVAPVVRLVEPPIPRPVAPAPPERLGGGDLLADLREQMKRRG
jgi:hypothetical protein